MSAGCRQASRGRGRSPSGTVPHPAGTCGRALARHQGLSEREGAGGEARKQTNISPCVQVVGDVGLGCRGFQRQPPFFLQPLPSRGVCAPFYSRSRFGAADWMWRGDARTGAERSSPHGTGGHRGGPAPAPISVSKRHLSERGSLPSLKHCLTVYEGLGKKINLA